MVNSTCPVETKARDPVPFIVDGKLNFKAHDVGWIISGAFTLVASIASFWLIWKHLTYYTCPQQQRHIVRMLFMVPIYAIVSWMSYLFYSEALYYETIRDCYEAVVITSFFYLLLQYVGDTRAEQHAVFRNIKLKKWFWPLGPWKYRPDGLHFLWLMKICILQYALVRPICTIVAVVLQYFNLYCLNSWMPYFGHVWIAVAISLSVTVAMYCIVQFYIPIEKELKPYSPILKFLAVKSVVFLTFWQSTFLSILAYFKVIHETEYMSSEEVQAGINALLETFEMVIFGFLHIKAFTYLIYRPADRARTTSRWRALIDVIDYRDWAREMKESNRYIYARSRGKDYTVVEDIRAAKYRHLALALGRDRAEALQAELEKEKGQASAVPWRRSLDAELEDGQPAASPEDDVLAEHGSLIPQPAADVTGSSGSIARSAIAMEHCDAGMASDHSPAEKYPYDNRQSHTVSPEHLQEEEQSMLPELHANYQAHHDRIGEARSGHNIDSLASASDETGMRAWWRYVRDRLSFTQHEDGERDGHGTSSVHENRESRSTELHTTQNYLYQNDSLQRRVSLSGQQSPLDQLISTHSSPDQAHAPLEGTETTRPRLLTSESALRATEMVATSSSYSRRGEEFTVEEGRQEDTVTSEMPTAKMTPTIAQVQLMAPSNPVVSDRASVSEFHSTTSASHTHISTAQPYAITSTAPQDRSELTRAHGEGAAAHEHRSASHGHHEVSRARTSRPPASRTSAAPSLSADRYGGEGHRSGMRVADNAALSFSPDQHSSQRASSDRASCTLPNAAPGLSDGLAGNPESAALVALQSRKLAVARSGPKGKVINISIPQPLSPARYPDQAAESFQATGQISELAGAVSVESPEALRPRQSYITTNNLAVSSPAQLPNNVPRQPPQQPQVPREMVPHRAGAVIQEHHRPGSSATRSAYTGPQSGPVRHSLHGPPTLARPAWPSRPALPVRGADELPRSLASAKRNADSLSFSPGDIITPAQRMNASYAPHISAQHHIMPSVVQPGYFQPMLPHREYPSMSQADVQLRNGWPVPHEIAATASGRLNHSGLPATRSSQLRGGTQYDRWSGEPLHDTRRRHSHIPPPTHRMPTWQDQSMAGRTALGGSVPRAPVARRQTDTVYDTVYHIEYID
ncbi:unnamed protein product [Parajaminaea phylloscopi]